MSEEREPITRVIASLNLLDGQTPRSEADLRARIAEHLRVSGWVATEQVACAAGAADIVARQAGVTAIIETKWRLNRRAVLQAASQLQLYALAIDPSARLVIAGFGASDTPEQEERARALGAELVALEDPQRLVASRQLASNPTAKSQHLRWNIHNLAIAHDLTTVSGLAAKTGFSRQGLYPLWRGTARQVALRTYGQLAIVLDARVGEWFRWQAGAQGRQLQWDIATAATRREVTAPQLGFRSGLYPRTISLYWRDQALFTTIGSLGRLAMALNAAEHPFDIGDLFIWAPGSPDAGTPPE